MSDGEHSGSAIEEKLSSRNHVEKDQKFENEERNQPKSNHKEKRSRSRSPKKMYAAHKGKYRSRSRSRSPRRRSRRSRSRSRSRSYEKRRDRRSFSHSPMSGRRRHTGSRDNPPANRCLGVFGLSVQTTEEELHRLFSKYGPVERVQVVIDAKSGRSRGFAFCYFESVEDAQIAREQCNEMEFDGRKIRVDFSITLRAHTPTPGVYMGKPTFMDRDRDRDYGGWRRGRGDYYDDYRGRRSPSPYYSSHRRWRYDRSRSRSYSPRRY